MRIDTRYRIGGVKGVEDIQACFEKSANGIKSLDVPFMTGGLICARHWRSQRQRGLTMLSARYPLSGCSRAWWVNFVNLVMQATRLNRPVL